MTDWIRDLRVASDLTATPVVVSPQLPYPPSIGEWARRIVRHGLADVLEWLGEEVGPAPDDQTHMLWVDGRVLVSQETYDRLAAMAVEREPTMRLDLGGWTP